MQGHITIIPEEIRSEEEIDRERETEEEIEREKETETETETEESRKEKQRKQEVKQSFQPLQLNNSRRSSNKRPQNSLLRSATAEVFSELKCPTTSKQKKHPSKHRGPIINTTYFTINRQIISEQERRQRKRNQMVASKTTLDTIYPLYLRDAQTFILWFCIAKSFLDSLNSQENTLINELELLINQLVAEYIIERAKGSKADREYIKYLEEIIQKGTAMVSKIKEFAAPPVDMLAKIGEFIEAAQANRIKCCAKVGRIVELLVFVAIGAVLGGLIGYAVGHLFFIAFAKAAISAGFSTGASLGLALGQSALGVGAIVATNLSIWTKFSVFYKETTIERLCESVAAAATNVVNKKIER